MHLPFEEAVQVAVGISRQWDPATIVGIPDVFTGGWVGYTGYDTVRYTYPTKIPFESAPTDDRNLLDMHLALYTETVIFDDATKLVYIVAWVDTGSIDSADEDGVQDLYLTAQLRVTDIQQKLQQSVPSISQARIRMSTTELPQAPQRCNMSKESFLEAVQTTKEHIVAGDVFQLVLSQRFERSTFADPFEVYRCVAVSASFFKIK